MDSREKVNVKTIVLGRKPLKDYLIEAVISLNRDADVVEIVGRGKNIHRAVNLYNALVSRVGERIKIRDIEIGSVLIKNRRVSYIKISVQRTS